MTGGLLLDTCAVLWTFAGLDLSEEARTEIDAAASESRLYLSPISAWEIGLLAARGRIALSMPVAQWVARSFGHPGTVIADLSPALLVESSFLPGEPHRDPADRMLIATARNLGLTLVTRDRLILDYARAGHLSALPC